VAPHSEAYFEAIWSRFLAKEFARVWIAELNGEPVAAENFGVYKKAAIYWTGAANAKGLGAEANSLLQWKAMQWMMRNGIEWYETGEAFPQAPDGKSKGISNFKKSFGGSLYPYYKGHLPAGSLWRHVYGCIRGRQ
jgi:lipid II:glycine glycyltransferase (peptidoglycan interpeptide bridge formation enzyme)